MLTIFDKLSAILSHPCCANLLPYLISTKSAKATKQAKSSNAMSVCKVPSSILSHLHNLRPQIQLSTKAAASKISSRSRRSLLLLSLPLSTFIISPAAFADADESFFDPVTVPEKRASDEISRRVSEALRLLDVARELQARGEFAQALDYFTQVVKDYKDFAFSDYARVGRALVLYEIGDRDESIAEMEDVSISLKGYPEVHAALAAALYVDKHAPLLAENQFTIATLLDPHYTDLSYVKETKHWPPSLVSSLQHFITLS